MGRASSALVVDSDIKGLEALVYGFQGVDWRITACPAPESAAFLVKASGAELVVAAAREPHDKLLAMLRQLRATEESRALPILVLGPAALRAPLRDLGTIELLPLPVFVRDVITASRLLVDAGKTGQDVQGRPADYGMLSLVRTLAELRRSGVLHLERGGRRGEISFAEGEIVAAQLGSLQGAAAVHHLMLWEDDARMELRVRPVTRRGGPQPHSGQALDEAERFLRDYAHAIKDVGPASAVYRRDETRLSMCARDVPAEVTPVLRLFDGNRALAGVIDDSPFRVFDTLRIVNRLVYLGVLVRRDPRPATTEQAGRPLQQFWSTARIVGAEGGAPAPADEAKIAKPENRIGAPSRRKGKRRVSNQTLDLGAPLVDAAGEASKGKPTPVVAAGARGEADPRGEGRPAPGLDRPVASRDWGIQLSPTLFPRAEEMNALPVTPPPQAVPRLVAPQAAPATSGAAVRPGDESAPKGMGAVKVAGTLSVPNAPRAAHRPKSPTGISVQFDPALMAEMGAMDKTPSPPTVSTTTNPPSGSRTADAGTDSHAAGIIAVPAPHRATTKPPPAGMSVDPALLAEMEVLERAERDSPALRVPAPGEVAPVVAERPASQPTPTAKDDLPKRHTSGAFSAVEADFFARESELYKQDDSSFADLDEPAGKPRRPRRSPPKR